VIILRKLITRLTGLWSVIYTNLSVYPLRSDEASKIPILFLDLAFEAKIILDDDFLEDLLKGLRARLSLKGAKKIMLEDGTWY